MRPRKWVLFCALGLFLLCGVFLLGKHKLERSRHIENLLIKAVTPSIKGSFTLDAFRIGFLSAYLRNVKVSLPTQSFSVDIHTIKIGFSLVKLFRYRGNVAKAINRIILIKPHCTLSLKTADTTSTPLPETFQETTPSSEIQFPASALQALIFKDGLLTLEDFNGDTLSVATHLSGVLLNNLLETSITASGRLGSSRKNVSLQALFSWPKNKHHLSLRIANANIDKPLVFNSFTVTDGMLNGAVECTFSTSFSPDSIETHGWINLSQGSVCFDSLQHCIYDVSIKTFLNGSSCQFSSSHATYRGIDLAAEGTLVLQPHAEGSLSLTATNVISDSLRGILPDSLISKIPAVDTVHANIGISDNTISSLQVQTNRCMFGTAPITNIYASIRPENGLILIDSLLFTTPFGRVYCDGTVPVNTDDNFVDLSFKLAADALPFTSALTGKMSVSGTVSGSVDQPDAGCIITGYNLVYKSIPLGNQQFLLNVSGGHLFFRSIAPENEADIYLSGTIDSIFSGHPFANATGKIAFSPIKQYLQRNELVSIVDSVVVTANVKGWLNDFNAAIAMYVAAPHVKGTFNAAIKQSPADSNSLSWQIKSSDAAINGKALPISGNGTMKDQTITIAALNGSERIRGSGAITLSPEMPPAIRARIEYLSVPCTQIDSFTRGAFPLDSGTISGVTEIRGTIGALSSTSRIHLDNFFKGTFGPFTTNIKVVTDTSAMVINPFIVEHAGDQFLSVDTVRSNKGHHSLRATIGNYPISRLLPGSELGTSPVIDGLLSATFSTTSNGLPLHFSLSAPSVTINTLSLDSVSCLGSATTKGLNITSLRFSDKNRSKGGASGSLPWSVLQKENIQTDTLMGSILIKGDLLSTIDHLFSSPVGGHGEGSADISFISTGGNWIFTKGTISIPEGTLEVSPFVPDKVRNYTGLFTIDSTGHVHTDMNGTIKKRPIRIFSTHTLPDGYEPLTIGPLDFGAFQVQTPEKGVDLHLPGFMALKDRGNIDFKGKSPFSEFTISGPLDKLKLTGTWLLRDLDFTFPFLPVKETSWSSDPFPFVTWEMDVKPGNRKVLYFWDLTGKKNRIMRFIEGYLDLSSIVRLRGRDMDKSFRVLGSIRSFKGTAYYGRAFDRNFDVGVEFNPQKPDKNAHYDNLPLLWGSAEAFADTSRYRRVKLTCMVVDPVTAATSEKGRLVNGPAPNIVFHVSSDFEELPGEGERDFYRQAGLTFSTIGGAGGAVSDFGEQMFHRYLLQRWERRIAKKLGLDVINIETSIVSNYFSKLYDRQFDGLLTDGDYLALANVGVTLGRYFFKDNVFLKARGELIPIDLMLTPEYSIGFEFQPSRYLLMDINYGFHKTETSIQHSPLLMLQLRLPISGLRRNLNF